MIRFWKGLNLPNRLTLMRIVLVPVYLVLLWLADQGNPMIPGLLALIVFCAASITDLFDGKIARARGLVTSFGKFMDPIADKMLTHTAFILLCWMGDLNVVACILFIAREFVVAGLREVAAEQGNVIAAGMSGKVKTVLQMSLIIVLTVNVMLNATRFSGMLDGLAAILTLAAAVMTVWSMVEYVWKNRAVLGDTKA